MMEKQTIVVKVGTSSLTLSDGTMDAEKIRNIVQWMYLYHGQQATM